MNGKERRDLWLVLNEIVRWRRGWSPADWQEACDLVKLELLDRQQSADQPAPHSYAIGAGGGDDGCSACGAGQHEPCKPDCIANPNPGGVVK